MPDAIATINGKPAMAYNERNGIPWHQLGTPIDGTADADQMIVAAGLDWDVVKQPIFAYGTGEHANALIPLSGEQLTNKMVTMRSIDSHPFGIVGATYQPIQNQELFDFAKALTDTGEGVQFETAGALYDGRVVWALASIPDRAIRIDGDDSEIMPYLVLSTGHDGLRAFAAHFTPVRVVCANTLAMARAGAQEMYLVRHTVKALNKVDEARKALKLNVDYIEALRAVSNQLMKRKMTIKDVLDFTTVLIPSTAVEPEKAVKAQRQRDSIVGLYQNSANLADVPFTAYRALQAVAEWADHDRVYRDTKKGSAADARALAILDGQALDIKDKALTLLLPTPPKRDKRGHFVKA